MVALLLIPVLIQLVCQGIEGVVIIDDDVSAWGKPLYPAAACIIHIPFFPAHGAGKGSQVAFQVIGIGSYPQLWIGHGQKVPHLVIGIGGLPFHGVCDRGQVVQDVIGKQGA